MKLTLFRGKALSTAVSRKSHNTNVKSTSPAQRHPSTNQLLAHGLQDITATRATNKKKQAITCKIRSAYYHWRKSRESRILKKVNS